MFDSVGWGEILVIVLAGLFILGPDRLPGAAAWLGRSIQQVKGFASGTQDRLRSELGPEFDELRQPLADLRALRGRDPRRIMVDALLRDDADPPRPDPQPSESDTAPPAASPSAPVAARPPFDADAT
ncbi:Sec-independent protein translocase protein TatB [Pseudonocardia pini]|uniref:Sec-independent protein translocase protein TatB n=1 Tax=Pseudonocardia pini TaxID=2758030 RepID=UPI0015F05500|nr:Sec-independent protein translocase protein TatB [Pseudonocardia pini]